MQETRKLNARQPISSGLPDNHLDSVRVVAELLIGMFCKWCDENGNLSIKPMTFAKWAASCCQRQGLWPSDFMNEDAEDAIQALMSLDYERRIEDLALYWRRVMTVYYDLMFEAFKREPFTGKPLT